MKCKGLSCIFPASDLVKTAEFYIDKLKFQGKEYLQSSEPHICLYKDNIEIILTQAKAKEIKPNRLLYGYGYDAYIYTNEPLKCQNEFEEAGVKIVKSFNKTDYQNNEVVIEDVDGRWVAFGFKEMGE